MTGMTRRMAAFAAAAVAAILAGTMAANALSAPATGAAAWKETCDSVSVLMRERSGVTVEVRLKSVLRKGGSLDLYFTDRLKDYPWRPSDAEWFREVLLDLRPEYCRSLGIGKIYAKAQPIEQLAVTPPGNGGEPAPSKFRTADLRTQAQPLVTREGQPFFDKGLGGRHIALWQSHGLYWNADYERWMWQRAPLFTTVEDLYTLTYVVPFLAPMLENAGASVMLPRERDFSTVEVTAYPEGNAWSVEIPQRGSYAVYVQYETTPESSDRALYTISHAGVETSFLVNQKMGGGTFIYLGTLEFDSGETRMTLENRGADGTSVSAGRLKIGGGTGDSGKPRYVEGARYWMEYAGVDRTVYDQNGGKSDYRDDFMSRGAWVNYLSAGSALHPGKYIPPKDGDGRQPAHRAGLGIPVDLSLGFHTDAGTCPKDSIIGTLAIYTRLCEGKGVFPSGEDRSANRELTDYVQTQIVDDIRALWNPEWSRRGLWDRSYSESRTPMVPAMLLELLSHQNFEDMKYGLDPRFRFTVSRAVYKAALKFLSSRYGCGYAVQPLPVHGFSAMLERNAVSLSWQPSEDPLEPTAAPERYMLYTRIGSGAFDNGVMIEGTSVKVAIEPGRVYSWKVAAMNSGGLSFPSEILSAGIPENGDGGRTVLVVNNFTRTGGPVWTDTPDYAGFNTSIDSGVPYICNPGYIGEMYEWRRSIDWKSDDNAGFGASFTDHAGEPVCGNTFDFAALHGASILSAGYAFCSCSAEWFETSCPGGIWAVDLVCGKQMTCRMGKGEPQFTVFSREMQSRIAALTASGTHFLVSGANIGKDTADNFWPLEIDPELARETSAFCSSVLGWRFAAGHATRTACVQPFSPRKGSAAIGEVMGFHFNNVPSPLRYCVESADAIAPAGQRSKTFLRYADSGMSAGICHDSGSYRTVCMGFPIEIITDGEAMDALVAASLNYFENAKYVAE